MRLCGRQIDRFKAGTTSERMPNAYSEGESDGSNEDKAFSSNESNEGFRVGKVDFLRNDEARAVGALFATRFQTAFSPCGKAGRT
jgi:hypothetical protein